MKQKINNAVFATILLLIGLVLLWFYVRTEVKPSGKEINVLKQYLTPGFQLATLIGGLGMCVVGSFLLLTLNRHSACGHDHGEDESCDAGHEHGDMHPVMAIVIILLPLTFAIVKTEHGYSEKELSRRSEADLNPEAFAAAQQIYPEFTLETLDKYKSKNANGAYQMEVMEIFLTAGDPTVSKVIDGLAVEIEGAVRSQPGDEKNPKVKRMYRMSITCCAADMQAIPLKLVLSDELAASYDLKEHTWVTLEGTVTYETDKQGIKKAVVNVTKMVESAPPDTEILQSGGNQKPRQFRSSPVMQDRL